MSYISVCCDRKWSEANGAVTIEFAGTQLPEPKPGQFVTLGVEIDDGIHYRAYSISGITAQGAVQLTVKKIAGGEVSTHIVDSLQVGDPLQVSEPLGLFNCIDAAPKDKVLLLSAGSGITPLMAMIRYWVLNPNQPDIHLVHVAPTEADTLFYKELLSLQASAKIKLSLLLTRTRSPIRLTQTELFTQCPDLGERSAYMCGPDGLMKDAQYWLQDAGVDISDIHKEIFTSAPLNLQAASASVETDLSDVEKASVNVDMASTRGSVNVAAFDAHATVETPSPLIDALEEMQLPIVAACRSGICGSCKCKVTKGDYTVTSTETLTEQEIHDGYVLACSTHVEGELEVEL